MDTEKTTTIVETDTATLAVTGPANPTPVVETPVVETPEAAPILKPTEAVKWIRKAASASDYIRAGLECHKYLVERLTVTPGRHERSAAVRMIEAEVSSKTGGRVQANVSRDIGIWAVSDLFGKEEMPITWYAELSMLVERTSEDTKAESYVILPGMEEECKALFTEISNGSMKGLGTVKERIIKIVASYKRSLADTKKAQAEQIDVTAAKKAADDKAMQVKVMQSQVNDLALAAAVAVKDKTPDADKLVAELKTLQEQLPVLKAAKVQCQHDADQAAQEKARLERSAKAAEDTATRLTTPKPQRSTEKTATEPEPYKGLRTGSVKDTAEFIAAELFARADGAYWDVLDMVTTMLEALEAKAGHVRKKVAA